MEVLSNLTRKYEKGEALIDDTSFDALQSIAEKAKGGKIETLGKNKGKVDLPKPMKSMEKITSQKELDKWINEWGKNVVVSGKFDGISALIDGNAMYTRGNGFKGIDISDAKEILSLPSSPPGTMIRGELIINLNKWNKEMIGVASTPLAFIGGWSMCKIKDTTWIHNIHFIAYQFITEKDDDEDIEMPILEQYRNLKALGFEIPYYHEEKVETIDQLEDLLMLARDEEEYTLDGIILYTKKDHKRIDDINPPYAKAFKDKTTFEAEIVDVEWNESKYGTLVPRIVIKKVLHEGKEYEYITGHNAKYVKENNVGAGAIVDVDINITPNVGDVIEEADEEYMESMFYHLEDTLKCKWSGVHLVSTDENSVVRRAKVIETFFANIGVEGIKYKSILKLMSKLSIYTIFDIMNLMEREWQKGLGKNGVKVWLQLEDKYNSCSDAEIIVASALFKGIGKTTASLLLGEGDIDDFIAGYISDAKGIGPKKLDIIRENIGEFIDWYIRLPKRTNVRKKRALKDGDIKAIMTGEPPLEWNGKKGYLDAHPELYDNKTKWSDVNILLTDSMGSMTGKMMKALEKGVKIMTYLEYHVESTL